MIGGWLAVCALALMAFALAAFLLRLPRQGLALFGAVLVLGLAGYAWQGSPGQPAAPKSQESRTSNQGEAMVHSVRKSLAEHADKIGDEDKGRIDDAIKALEESLKGEDKEAIEAKTEALMTASQKLGEKVYAASQAEAAAAGGDQGAGAASAKPADDDVVDAEVKEVKKG